MTAMKGMQHDDYMAGSLQICSENLIAQSRMGLGPGLFVA